MIAQSLERYPYPIAYPARLWKIANDPADQLEKATHFVELVAATLGVLALSWCQARSVAPTGIVKWEKKLEPGIALGVWIEAIQSASKEMAGSPNDPMARAARLSADAVLPGLRTYAPQRNVYAHGGKPRLRPDQESVVSDFREGIPAVLGALEPLTRVRFGLVTGCRRSGAAYEISLDIMTGFAEPFPNHRLRSHKLYDEKTVVAYHGNSLEFALDLTPFCVQKRCPKCHQQELFYLHQRKKGKSHYFSFSTGHPLVLKGNSERAARDHITAMRMEPPGSAQAAASSGWRAIWPDLASRPRRIAGRTVDLTAVAALLIVAWFLTALFGLSAVASATIAALLAILYEPVTALSGGTLGKRLLRIEAISTWTGRALSPGDTLRRALFADAQLLVPPLAVYNLAWLLFDPARQCFHDRRAASIVTAGRAVRSHRT